MLSTDIIITAGSLLAGAGAAVSAVIAWRSFCATERLQDEYFQKEKERIWKDIQIVAARAEAKKDSVARVAEDLVLAYKTLFAFAGQGAGSSRRDLYINRVEATKSDAFTDWNNVDRAASAHSKLADLDYQSAADTLVRIEAYLSGLATQRLRLDPDL